MTLICYNTHSIMVIEEPPLIRGTNYIILIAIIFSLFFPATAHEAFNNCCQSPHKITWNIDQMESALLIVSNEFAPEIKTTILKSYGNGACVPYSRYKTDIQLSGWAGDLLDNAEDAGYVTSTVPAQGGMVITNESKGHVAVVEEVKDDSIIVSEQNYKVLHIVSTRKIPVDSSIIQGYIYAN